MTTAGEVDLRLISVAALLESDPAAAARAAAQLLAAHPGHRAAALLLGNAQRAAGDAAGALATFQAQAAAQPDSALLQLEVARALLALGRSDGAAAALARATELEPGLAPAWRERSLLDAARGETLDCDRAYARYTALVLEDAHLAEAGSAIAFERYAAAEALLQAVLARAPGEVAALRMLAWVARAREDYAQAEQLLGECLRRAPGHSAARFDLVQLLSLQQKGAPMLPLLERLLAFDPASFAYRTMQAHAHTLLGDTQRAEQMLRALIAERPDNEQAWLHYGHTLRFSGELAGAIDAYRRSAALKPQFGEAWFSLANLKTVRFSDADAAAMRAQLERSELRDSDRLHFEFALGKAEEDAARYGEAFAHYLRGNALRRAQVRYDPDTSTQLVRRTQALYTREFFAARAGWGCAAPDPIFIVGMPRAGSTLIEQILASHSQVEGTRELPDVIGFALELGLRHHSIRGNAYPQSVARLSRAELAARGERYLAQTRLNRSLGRAHFIDKAPMNFLQVGLIHLMLPNARIIDARRGALACCFANFKQHFQSGVFFTYSLEDVGAFYRDYVQLMAHFDAVLPGRIHRVQYERVVADLEGEVRRLLDYCGLPFEEQCLRFYETRRSVQTVSSEQVRRPIYAEGLDQWRHFEPWLGPLKQALGPLAAD